VKTAGRGEPLVHVVEGGGVTVPEHCHQG